ncbi:MAG: glutaredoxin [Flavobacteriaceae bacterium]|nr:glutaredoxin [Flavobacteriaceae bacterium]
MKYKVIILILLFTTAFSYAQKEKVIVTEKKQGKRITLFAENTTQDTLNVFIMLTAQGYRRSADRPVVMNIPPKRKVRVMTLIEMDDQESSYTYNLIVNEKLDNSITVNPEKDIADIETVIKGKIVVFSKTDCPKCETLSAFLYKEQINHRVININEDPKLYRQFMNFIDKELKENTQIRFPVIWNKTYTIFGYDDLEQIVREIGENK